MNKLIRLVFLTMVLFTYSTIAQNVSNVDVNALSDQQIQQIIQEVQSRGLTIDQAALIAQSRGASPTQINDLKRRIQELQSSGAQPQSIVSPGAETTQSSKIVRAAFSEKAKIKASSINKKVFGYNLFNNENLTFEPSVNIPAPKDYVLGLGDEILINIWGASQQTYQLVIGQNGAINIPDLGPVYLNGLSFDDAKVKIHRRLIAIYSGMGGENPNTYSDVSISNLRTIKINIVGEAIVPGTYNLPATATIFNALYLSGGPNENGSFRAIKLIRDGQVIKTIDVYEFILNANMSGNSQLRDQDILFIPTYNIRVEVEGAFKRTAFFELLENENVGNLIKYAGEFKDNAFRNRVTITRFTENEKEVIDVEESNFATYQLQNGDVMTAGVLLDRFENRVTISGAVFRPGIYELSEDLTLSALIEKASGVREDVYTNKGLIIREKDNKEFEVLNFNVKEVLEGKNDYLLKKEDRIEITDIFSMQEDKFIKVTGEVNSEGNFPYYENITLGDALFLAKGLKVSADTTYVEVSRRLNFEEMTSVTNKLAHIYTFSISRDLSQNSNLDFKLEPYDNINVRKSPGFQELSNVQILGEVKFAGTFALKDKRMRISDLVRLSGGLTPHAYINGAAFTRYTEEFGYEVVAVDLYNILNNPNSKVDLLLRAGDVLNIPRKLQTVKISGAVQNPLSLPFVEGKTLKYYINLSGGFNTDAVRRKVYVKYPNGKTQATKVFFAKNYPQIEPGSEIIVPAKPEKQRVDNSSKWMAWSSIIASLAVAFATIFKN